MWGHIIRGERQGYGSLCLKSENCKPLTPPIELIDGNAYQFEYVNICSGIYGEKMNRFYHQNGFISASVCINITLLTQGLKNEFI